MKAVAIRRGPMRRLAAVLCLTVLFGLALPLGAEEAEDVRSGAEPALPAKIVARDGRVFVAELIEETPEQIKIVDIKTGTPVTLLSDSIVRLKRGIGEQEAINWTGLAPYLAWRVKQAQEVTPTGQIVTVTPTAVYVNLGERDGLEKGDKLKVYREGEKLTDPETGEVLGVIRSLVADLEVVEVQEKLSKAKRTTDIETELERGNAVELEWSRKAVAVLPISVPRKEDRDLARSVREEWTTALVGRGVPVVERVQMEKVLEELGVQQTFLVDAETTSKLGEMVGAYAVLTGSIAPAGQKLRIHARLLKVRTGEALLATSSDVDPHVLLELGLAPEALPIATVEQPMTMPAATPAVPQQGGSAQQALQKRVTLRRPYPESYPGAETHRMSVQYAVMAVVEQVGLRYNFDESRRNTDPQCREWVTPEIVNVAAYQALEMILAPKGLTYQLRGEEIVLVRRR